MAHSEAVVRLRSSLPTGFRLLPLRPALDVVWDRKHQKWLCADWTESCMLQAACREWCPQWCAASASSRRAFRASGSANATAYGSEGAAHRRRLHATRSFWWCDTRVTGAQESEVPDGGTQSRTSGPRKPRGRLVYAILLLLLTGALQTTPIKSNECKIMNINLLLYTCMSAV